MDLVLGVIRNQRTLDAVVERWSGRPGVRIQRSLVNVIRVAAFEAVYCPLTPLHAVVYEAVDLARRSGGRGQAGFVNAVLRQVTGHIADRQVPFAGADPLRAIPVDAGHACLFDEDLLPDPKTIPHDYLAVCFSLPAWLMQDWILRFGWESARIAVLASNRRPSVVLRPNPLKTTAEALQARLERAGIRAEAGDREWIRLASAGQVEQMPGYSEGLFSVQDPSAGHVVEDLAPARGESILDLCSAPGGKTIQMAEQVGDQARIVATDADPDRLGKVRENVARMGLRSVTILPEAELQAYVDLHGPFDAVLLDVPCSNTGVLARRVEVRHRLRPAAIEDLARTQIGLMHRAAGFVRPGGRMVYSTCSIQSAENESVVQAFLCSRPDFSLASQRLTLPSPGPMDHDGGFVAALATGSERR